ncbi:MAG: long-chain fatty acid--CoA ligase, partial [Duncaniella sp.]|nr:long-chain fatty acid--CoA ligase [Duncaniella sp.]
NNMPYVAELLVIDSGAGRLVALIVPDLESCQLQGYSHADIERIMDENISTLNSSLPSYSQIQSFRIQEEEFEKTPKRSIKRYLYK